MSSIIPQIFSPAGDVTKTSVRCAPELRELRQLLLDHTATRYSSSAAPAREDQRAWFAKWDQRLFKAKPACSDSEAQAWTELNRLRYGLAALGDRFEQEELPHLQRLEQLIGPADPDGRLSASDTR